MSYDYSSDYVRDTRVAKPDHSYEDILIAEVRRLEEEVTTLKATLGMVRKVLGAMSVGPQTGKSDLPRIVDALGTV